MSELDHLGFDPYEYADQLGYTDELGKGDYSDPNLVRAETPEERQRYGHFDRGSAAARISPT